MGIFSNRTNWHALRIAILIFITTGAFTPNAAISQTITLNTGDDIQATVDVAVSGTTIELNAGTYAITQQIVIPHGKDLTIKGVGGQAIIQQTGTNQRVISVGTTPGGLSSHLTLEHITVTGGNVSGSGGGIMVYRHSGLTLIDGTVSGNTATGTGGGIHIGDGIAGTGKLWLINSNLIGNTSGSYGGGAYLGITNQFLMYGGEVRDNQASGVNHGGGLMIWINTSGFIRGTSFINNTYQGGDSHIGFATGGGQGSVNLDGNYWEPFTPTTGFTVTPKPASPDPSNQVQLSVDRIGSGGGTVSISHDAALDVGYATILDMLATLQYGGLGTADAHYQTMVTDHGDGSWTVPVGMHFEVSASADDGSVFHGWRGGEDFSGSSSPINIRIPGADVSAEAAFWTKAAKVVLTGPSTAVAGEVTPVDSLLQVTVLDVHELPTRVLQNTRINLSSNGPGTFFKTDGTTSLSFVDIVPGGDLGTESTPAEARFRSTQAGTQLIAANWGSGGPELQNDTMAITVFSSTPDADLSAMAADPTVIIAGGLASSAITVTVVDKYGNGIPGEHVYLELSAGTGTLSAGPWTTDSLGVVSATLTSAASTGSGTVKAFLGTDNSGEYIGEVIVTFVPGPANLSTTLISADPSTIPTDSSSTITVQLKDAAGNNLTSSGGTVALYTSLGELTDFQDNADGTYTATLTSTLPGTAIISGTLDGDNLADTAGVTITVGAASLTASTITAVPSEITTDETATITVQLKDAAGNNLSASGGTVVLTTTLGTLDDFQDNADGTYTATLSSTIPGTATISGTLDGDNLADTAGVEISVGAASLATSTITASPSEITTDETATITVQLKDAAGNNLTASGGAVALYTSLGELDDFQDNADGTYTATLSSTIPGTAIISGTLDGNNLADTAEVEITVGAASLATSTITASPSEITTDETATITVQLKDAAGNNLTASGGTVVLTTTLGTLGDFQDNADGTYTATLSSTVPGTAIITGTLDGDNLADTAEVEITVGAASLVTTTITADPTTITTDGSSTITVQLKDAAGNNLTASGGTVVLTTTLGTLDDFQDNADGTYTATLSSTIPGTAIISGTLDGNNLTDTAEVEITVGAASLATSTITASPSEITTDETATITVQLKDAAGNNLTASGGAVALYTSLGELDDFQDNADGTYTATLSSTIPGTAIISGTLDGNNLADTAEVEITVGAASLATSTITASPSEITTDETATITVQLKDAAGNNLTASGGTVVLTTTLGTLDDFQDNADGTYTATLSSTVPGTAIISGTLDGNNLADTAGVTITVGAASLTASTITADPSTITTDGSSTITVQLKDAAGNNLTASGGTVVLTTTLGTLGDFQDNADGTYTATLSSTVPGTAIISGTLDGNNLADTAGVEIQVGAASLATTTITADPAAITTDGSSTITVQLKDAAGNNLTSSGGTVALYTSLGELSDFQDNADGTYTATLTSLVPGTAIISGTLDGNDLADTAGVEITVGAASLATSTITASPSEITTDETATITVQLKDAAGNNLSASGGTVVLTTTLGTLDNFQYNADGTYTATLSSTVPGTAIITGTLDGDNLADTAEVEIQVGAASLATTTITADPAAITTDGSSTITVQLKDAAGNNLTASGGTVVLTTTLGTLDDFQDNADGTYTATLTSTVPGTAIITGTLDGDNLADTAGVEIQVGAASLATTTITADPTTITTDGSSTITVQLKDAAGNNLTSSGGTVVLTTTLGTLDNFQDNADGTYTATLSSTVPGTAIITGTLDGDNLADTAEVEIQVGAASLATTTITADPAAITTDGSSTITVQLKDAAGNNLTASGGTVVLTTTLGTLDDFQDNADGTYTATLSSTVPGTAIITGTLDGDNLADTAGVEITVGAASLTASTITADPSTITTDGSSTITVQLKDAAGNNLTSSGGAVVLNTTLGALNDFQDNADGTYTATLSSTVPGTAIITGTLDGDNLADTAGVEISVGTASLTASTITAVPSEITTDETATITVQLKDAAGNNLTSSGGTVVLTTTLGTLDDFQDNADGTYTATLSSTVPGTAIITGTLDGDNLADTAGVEITVGAASLTASTITADPSAITTDGSSTITVQLKDAAGNNLTASGGTVALYTSLGELTDFQDNADGTYTATLSSTVPGTAIITGTLDGDNLADTAEVEITVGAASLATTTITADPAAITTDGSSTITVQLKDAAGNNLTSSGGTVVLTTTLGTLDDFQDNADGTYTATLSSTVPGTAIITGTLDGDNLADTAGVEITVGAASLTASTITADPSAITTDGSSTITVQLKDAAGNNLTASGGTVVLTTTLGTLDDFQDNADGTYTATLSSTIPGTATISGTLDGDNLADTAGVEISVGAASLATSTITASPSEITTDEIATITVQLKDAAGNNLTSSGGAVALYTSLGELNDFQDNADGTYTATLTSTVPGTAIITGTLDGDNLADTAGVEITVGAASLTASTITADPSTITTDGSSTITVQLKDAAGNNLTASGGTVVLTTTLGTLGDFQDNADGTYTTTLSSTVPGTATISGTLDGDNLADAAEVTILEGSADPATSTVTAASPAITTDQVVTITVQLKDAAGNHLTASGGVVTLNTTLGILTGVTDHGNGTYTATLSSTAPGTAIISGTLNGVPISDTDEVVFSLGTADPGTTTIVAAPTVITTIQTATVTVHLRDAAGNILNTSGGLVTLTTNLGTLGEVTDHGDGTYTAAFTSSEAGVALIKGTLNGHPILEYTHVTVEQASADPAKSLITADPSTLGPNDTAIITVQLKDAAGNNLTTSGGIVVLAATRGELSGVTDNLDGTYTALFTPVETGTAWITGTLNGENIGDGAEITISYGSGKEETVIAYVGNGTAGSVTTITVSIQDEAGNPVVDALARLAGDVSGNNDQPLIFVNNFDGTYTASYIPTVAGEDVIRIKIDGKAIEGAPFISRVAPAAAARLRIVSQPSQWARSGKPFDRQPVLQLADAWGNAVALADQSVTVAVSAGGALIGESTVLTDRDGIASFVNLGILGHVGTYALTFSVQELDNATSDEVQLQAGDPAKLVIITQPVVGLNGDLLAVQPRVEILDAAGNPVPDNQTSVTILVSGGQGAVLSGTTTLTAVDGIISFHDLALSGAVGVSYRLVVKANGLEADESDPLVFLTDGMQPSVAISGPDSPTNQRPFEIRIVFSRGVTGFEIGDIVLQGGTIAPASLISQDSGRSWTARVLPAGDGLLTIHIPAGVAMDAAGSVNTASEEYLVVFDGTAPAAPELQLASGDTLTNNPRPEIVGMAEPGSVVTVKDAQGAIIGTVAANPDGIWRIIPADAMASGHHRLTATAVDKAGNASPVSVELRITIDLDPPARPAAASLVDGGNSTLQSRPAMTGSTEPGATVIIRDGNGNIVGTGAADPSGIWVLIPSVDLGPGLHEITVTAVDKAGNESPPSTPFLFTRIISDAVKATNVVTPNGDGINDQFVIENIELYPNNTVTIFDKAGRVLYRVKGYKNEWDGTLNGVPLHEGTYYYILDYGNGEPVLRGFISIVRRY